MNYTEIELAPGKTFKFTPASFNEETADLMSEFINPGDNGPNLRIVLPGLAREIRKSLAVNHTPEAVAEAQSYIRLDMKEGSPLQAAAKAILGL